MSVARDLGRRNAQDRGDRLNEGTYYYTIDLGNGTVEKGFITVINH